MNRLLSFKRPIPIRSNGVAEGDTDQVTGAVWYPMTGAYETRGIAKVRFMMWMAGPNLQAAPGMQLSHDGIYWDTATTDFGILGSFNGTETWAEAASSGLPLGSGQAAFPGAFEARHDSSSGTAITNNRLYVRFGLFVRNKDGAEGHLGGMAALEVQIKRRESGTVAGEPLLVASGGGSNALFTPLTEAVAGDEIVDVRPTVHIESNGGVGVTLAFEESDDGVDWSNPVDLEDPMIGLTTFSSTGYTYPTAWWTLYTAPTKKWVRFGVKVKNTNTGDGEYKSAVVGVRMDWRN